MLIIALVAISASSPHRAIFISPKYAGSVHDFNIYKETSKKYQSYLKVVPEDRVNTPQLTNRRYFDLLADRG